MKNIRSLISMMVFFVPVNFLLAQNNPECKQLFTKYIAGLGEFQVPENGKKYFVHITTSTFLNKKATNYTQSPYSSENIDVKIIMAKGLMFYYSTHINFYEDSQDAFTIIHPQKLILWRKVTPQNNETTGQQRNPMSMLRKKIFDELTMTKCVDALLSGKKVKQIEMIPKEELQKQAQIQKINYWYNANDNKLEKQELVFFENSPTLRQEFMYNEFNDNYKGNVANSAFNNVFDSRKKLLKAYVGYTVDFQ